MDEVLTAVARYFRRSEDRRVFALLSPISMSCMARCEPPEYFAADILGCSRGGGGVTLRAKLDEPTDLLAMSRALDFYTSAVSTFNSIHGGQSIIEVALSGTPGVIAQGVERVTFHPSVVPVRIGRLDLSAEVNVPAVVRSIVFPRDPHAVTAPRSVAAPLLSLRAASFSNAADVRGVELLPSLEVFSLSNSHRCAALSSLRGRLPQLSRMVIASCSITDADLATIGSLQSLTCLVLVDIPSITSLSPLAAQCIGRDHPLPHLVRLECRHCTGVVSVRGVEQLRSIQELSIAGCTGIPVAATTQLLTKDCGDRKSLLSLDISGVTLAVGQALPLRALAPPARYLTDALFSLVWEAGRWAMDPSLLVRSFLTESFFPGLRELRIPLLSPMNDAIAAKLVAALPHLTLLEMCGATMDVTSAAFLRDSGPFLVDVSVVFATPFRLDEASKGLLQSRFWRRLRLRVDDPVKWHEHAEGDDLTFLR